MTKCRQAYTLRTTGLSWAAIAAAIYETETPAPNQRWNAAHLAKYYAGQTDKPWPVPGTRSDRPPPPRGKLWGVDLNRPVADIIRETGCTPSAISAARKRAGLPMRSRVPGAYPTRQWTAAEIAKIQRLRRAGWTYPEIAEDFGTSVSAVRFARVCDDAMAAK